MIIDYDHNPNISYDQKLQSLKESVQMALNDVESKVSSVSSALADVKKNITQIIRQIDDIRSSSLIGTVSNVYWWGNTWTAPSDGMMVLRITPSSNSNWYWYVSDSSISGTTGSWSHQFHGNDSTTVTYSIPIKKGATYGTAMMSNNISTIYCFFYPMNVGGTA